jgi:PhzF family phenazine biosynthesis protein
MMAAPRSIEIFEYNAFTDQPFAGNPAAVVTDGSGLDDDVMQMIARQMNLAETAFLVPPSNPEAHVRLRWFTPAMEVELCGHATIAAFTAAAERDVFPVSEGDDRVLKVETLSGLLRIRVGRVDGAVRVAMQVPVPSFDPLDINPRDFAALWGVTPKDMAGEWLVHTGLNYWYLPIHNREAMAKLTLDVDGLAKIDDSAAFVFFSRDTVDIDSSWHIRFFAPFHGVDEDIVTGSAQGPMGVVHLGTIGSHPGEGWMEMKGEQGDLLGRPGRVLVRVRQDAGVVSDLEIVGGAVSMLEGRIRI